METNRKIAEWLGYSYHEDTTPDWDYTEVEIHWYEYKGLNYCVDELPDFLHSDADAITLLPVLVERGFSVQVQHISPTQWSCSIWNKDETVSIYKGGRQCISAAICAAIEQLIDKEGEE